MKTALLRVSTLFKLGLAASILVLAGCTSLEKHKSIDTQTKPLAEELTDDAQFQFALNLVKLQIEKEQYAEAENLLMRLRRDKDDIEVYRLLGRVYELNNKGKLSYLSHKKVLDFSDHTLDDEANYASAALHLEHYDEAKAIYEVWAQDEDQKLKVAGLNNLGFIHLIQEDYAAAKEHFSKALLIDPLNTRSLNNLDFVIILEEKGYEKDS